MNLRVTDDDRLVSCDEEARRDDKEQEKKRKQVRFYRLDERARHQIFPNIFDLKIGRLINWLINLLV